MATHTFHVVLLVGLQELVAVQSSVAFTPFATEGWGSLETNGSK